MDDRYAWVKRLSTYFVFEGKDAIGVIEASKARLSYIRRSFSFAGAVALYFSLEVNSPRYSVLELIRGIANAGAGGSTPGAFTVPGHDPVSVKYFIKLIAFLAFLVLFWAQISFADPLSSNLFLRKINSDNHPRRNFWKKWLFRPSMLDEQKFASLLPSAHLPRMCPSCAHASACSSHVQSPDEFIDNHSFNVWRSLYYSGRLDIDTVKSLASSVLKARAFYYLRKVCLVVAYGSILMFLLHRLLEFYAGRVPEYPPLAFATFALPLAAVWFFGIISDPSAETHRGGIWAELKGAADGAIANLSGSDKYHEVYQDVVCKPKISSRSFEQVAPDSSNIEHLADAGERHGALIGRLLEHMDELVTEKLASVILTNQNIQQKDHPSGVASSAVCFYERAFPSGTPFSSAVIKHLDLTSIVTSQGRGPDLAEVITREIAIKGYFFINRRTAAVNVKFRSDIGSLLILPIKIGIMHRERLRKRLANSSASAYDIESNNAGWFLLTSRHDGLFTSGSMPFHLQVLSPFVHRLYVELIRDSLVKRKGAKR